MSRSEFQRHDFGRRGLLLRLGVGAAVLPLLTRARRAHAAPVARRFVCVMQTGGYVQDSWAPPAGALDDQRLPLSCEPLQPHKGNLVFLPQLSHLPGDLGDAGAGCTTCGPGAYGTVFHGSAAPGGGKYKEPAGATIDQVIAAAARRSSAQRPSLALGVQLDRGPRLDPAPGYDHCFWAGPGAPIAPQLDPVQTYRDLFGGGAGTSVMERLVAQRRSVLDQVGASLEHFRARLGTADQQIVDAHHTAVRELERALGSTASGLPAGQCLGGDPVPGAGVDRGSGANYAQVLDLQMTLLRTALSCGVTNVATLQLSDATGANVDPTFIAGVRRTSWRDLATDRRRLADKRRLDRWLMERLAKLLLDLQNTAVSGRERPLLDDTVVLWGNHMRDGQSQDASRIPWILAAASGGVSRLRTGLCLTGTGPVSSGGPALRGVLASLCHGFAIATHPFGDPLPELTG
jgi:hypothetical protein